MHDFWNTSMDVSIDRAFEHMREAFQFNRSVLGQLNFFRQQVCSSHDIVNGIFNRALDRDDFMPNPSSRHECRERRTIQHQCNLPCKLFICLAVRCFSIQRKRLAIHKTILLLVVGIIHHRFHWTQAHIRGGGCGGGFGCG